MCRFISCVILALAAVAILGTAALHGIVNVPHLREDMAGIGARPSLVGAVTPVLYFSVAAMIAFGGLVLSGTVQCIRGGSLQRTPLWIVAITYVAFGLAAFVQFGRSPHYLGYAAMGLLVAIGAALHKPTSSLNSRTPIYS